MCIILKNTIEESFGTVKHPSVEVLLNISAWKIEDQYQNNLTVGW